MNRIELTSPPPRGRASTHGPIAFAASFGFHGVLLGLIVALSIGYPSHPLPIKSGSAAGSPSIALSTLEIIAPPPEPPTPAPVAPARAASPALSSSVASSTAQRETGVRSPPPEQGLPVLAAQPPGKRTKTGPAKTAPAARSPFPSSYASGPNVWPHPPYPAEARDLQQSGTVLMTVEFDGEGGVAEANVAQSSGVPLLDASTRSFIRSHWHSPAYAGQTVSVPVRYTLKDL